MRRIWVVALVLIGLAVVGWLGFSQGYLPSLSPTPTPTPIQEFETVIWASGKVVPMTWTTLSFEIGGQVVGLSVSAGDQVSEGQVLALLNDSALVDAVKLAEADLAAAEAELSRVSAGASPAEVAGAEAAVAAAEALRDAAMAQRAKSQADLDLLLTGPSSQDIEVAAANVLKADAALRLVQAEYDKIAWADDVGESPQALALEQATLDYQMAQADYQGVLNGARDQEIEAARQVLAAGDAQVAQAEAEVSSAEAALELVQTGAKPEEISVAQSAVNQASTRLAAAQNSLDQAVLTAPFAGTVGEVYVREGETVIPGQPQPVLILGDLGSLQVETTDLRETDVGHIEVGQVVGLTFDALPDVELSGHIVSINPMATSEKGGVNYTTVVAFDETDSRLRWGMTAYVNILVK